MRACLQSGKSLVRAARLSKRCPEFIEGRCLRGFTLTEMAIVAAVAGLVLGALWVAAGMAWQNYRLYSLHQQILGVVQGIRDRAQPPLPGVDGAVITGALNTLGLIPPDMVAGGNYFHALGGAFTATRINANVLRLQLGGVTQQDCSTLIMQMPVLSIDAAIVFIGANGNGANITLSNVADPGNGTALPITLATATGWCNLAGNANNVSIDFSM